MVKNLHRIETLHFTIVHIEIFELKLLFKLNYSTDIICMEIFLICGFYLNSLGVIQNYELIIMISIYNLGIK